MFKFFEAFEFEPIWLLIYLKGMKVCASRNKEC